MILFLITNFKITNYSNYDAGGAEVEGAVVVVAGHFDSKMQLLLASRMNPVLQTHPPPHSIASQWKFSPHLSGQTGKHWTYFSCLLHFTTEERNIVNLRS